MGLKDRIQRLEGARARLPRAPAPPPLSEAKQRQFEQLFALQENARAELVGEPPPHAVEPDMPEDVGDERRTIEWLRGSGSWDSPQGVAFLEEWEAVIRGAS